MTPFSTHTLIPCFIIAVLAALLCPCDAGAQEARYASWNTFLGMQNIIEIANTGDAAELVTVSTFDSAGILRATQTVSVEGTQQRDLILNLSFNLPALSYGTVMFQATNAVIARVSFYLPDVASSGFQFAYAQPVRTASAGSSFVTLNTHQPSTDSRDSGRLTENWLAIVNLDSTRSANFSVEQYDANGNNIGQTSIEVAPFGRYDLASGHETGAQIVGMKRIIPADPSSPYLAQLVRYGPAPEPGRYRFAFPLFAEAAAAAEQWVGLSRGANAANWIEIANVTETAIDITLEIFGNDGSSMLNGVVTLLLPPFAQHHFNAAAALPPGGSGVARIRAAQAGSFIAQSMFYHADNAGRVRAVYGFPAREMVSDERVSSWNLFLGTQNWLRVFNTTESPITATENVLNSNFSNPRTFVLAPHTGIDLGLHETGRYGTTRNAFGLVSVSGGALLTEIVRIVPASDGGIDAAFPVPFTPGTVAARPEATIFRPAPGTSWQWQLSGTIDTSFQVDMYDIDLVNTPQATIDELKAAGRKVVCYFSAGTWESFRSDSALFPQSVIGRKLDDFPDERWLDIRRIDLLSPVLLGRLDLAVTKGCDGVEPDNVDAYTNNSGFPLSATDQLTFNRWLADQAHARNLSVGLKNDVDQIPELVDWFDWALNEQCFEFNECAGYAAFTSRNKAVFGVEYQGTLASFCPQANAMNLDWLRKNFDLDATRQSCR